MIALRVMLIITRSSVNLDFNVLDSQALSSEFPLLQQIVCRDFLVLIDKYQIRSCTVKHTNGYI